MGEGEMGVLIENSKKCYSDYFFKRAKHLEKKIQCLKRIIKRKSRYEKKELPKIILEELVRRSDELRWQINHLNPKKDQQYEILNEEMKKLEASIRSSFQKLH